MKELSTTSLLESLFHGFYVSAILTGMVLVAGWKYFHTNKDGWILRLLVTSSIVLVTIAGGCKVAVVHHFMIRGFGKHEIFTTPYVMINITYVITGCIIFLVQIFFASRLWLLTMNRWLAGSIVLLSGGMLGLNAYGGLANPHHLPTIRISILLFHVTAVLNDILVTLGFCIYFHRSQPSIMSRGTATIVQRLLNFVVIRVILLCAVQIGHLVMYMMRPTDYLFWISLHLVIDPLNVITMLVILNSRPHQRETMEIVRPVTDLDFVERAPRRPISESSMASSKSTTCIWTNDLER